jgi:hypothetical protein
VVHATWSPADWADRQVVKAEPFRLARFSTPDEARDLVEESSEGEW